jgi:hypothetical protein
MNDFVIIGFPKCGTTSLITNLSKFSCVQVIPGEPTLDFFLNSHIQRNKHILGFKNPSIIYTLDKWFPIIENKKIIVCCRDQKDFLVSYYNYRKKEYPNKNVSFVDIVHQGKEIEGFSLETVLFDKFLKQLYELFDYENVLILPLELVKTNEQKYYNIVRDFLNLPNEKINYTKENTGQYSMCMGSEMEKYLDNKLQASIQKTSDYIKKSLLYFDK